MTRTSTSTVRELTVRSVVLGGLITLVFTAANVYLGLKVGLTFVDTESLTAAGVRLTSRQVSQEN